VQRLEQAESADCAGERTLEAIDELLVLAQTVLRPSARHHLEEAKIRLAEGRFNLVLLGEFKRGKSTLANALVGKPLLPADVVPLTSAVAVLRYGPAERLLVRFQGGREEDHAVDRLADFVTEPANPSNRLGVELTVVETPNDLLSAGLQVVDTPGIGSIYGHNTETAREFLPQVDAALFVLTADQPLSESERELVHDALERVPRVFFAVNKIDNLAPTDRAAAVRFIRDGLEPIFGFVIKTVRARFERVAVECEETIASELEGLERRHAERVEQIIDEVTEIAADAFGAGLGLRRPELGLQAPSRFSFKLRDEQQMIEHIAAAGRPIIPGRIGRQLVRRDAEQRLLGLVDRHAGRLRSDLSERVRESVREHEKQRSFLVDEAIESIRTAIERATRQQRAGELQWSERRAELESIARRAGELSAALEETEATA
jgi:GTPase SAR1 family protein